MLPNPNTAAAEDNTAPRHTRMSSAGGGNLLVAGLLRHTNEDGLRALFEPYGKVVRAIVMLDPVTAQSRGFGFVLMETVEGAEAARHALHGTMCGPNRLNVRKSFHDGRVVESNAVFVRNIAPTATAEEIASRFAKAGPVRSVVFTPAAGSASSSPSDLHAEPAHHRVDASALAAYIEYDSIDEARTAIDIFHLQPFYASDRAGAGSSDGTPSPMLVKFAERYSERKQRQHETASRVPQRPASKQPTVLSPARGLPTNQQQQQHLHHQGHGESPPLTYTMHSASAPDNPSRAVPLAALPLEAYSAVPLPSHQASPASLLMIHPHAYTTTTTVPSPPVLDAPHHPSAFPAWPHHQAPAPPPVLPPGSSIQQWLIPTGGGGRHIPPYPAASPAHGGVDAAYLPQQAVPQQHHHHHHHAQHATVYFSSPGHIEQAPTPTTGGSSQPWMLHNTHHPHHHHHYLHHHATFTPTVPPAPALQQHHMPPPPPPPQHVYHPSHVTWQPSYYNPSLPQSPPPPTTHVFQQHHPTQPH